MMTVVSYILVYTVIKLGAKVKDIAACYETPSIAYNKNVND